MTCSCAETEPCRCAECGAAVAAREAELKLRAALLAGVPGPWRALCLHGGTLPWAAIEEADEPGRGRILFLDDEPTARILASALNLAQRGPGDAP